MALKDEKLGIKVNSGEKDLIAEIAKELDIPVSQFVREAVREKIAAHKESQARSEEAATV